MEPPVPALAFGALPGYQEPAREGGNGSGTLPPTATTKTAKTPTVGMTPLSPAASPPPVTPGPPPDDADDEEDVSGDGSDAEGEEEGSSADDAVSLISSSTGSTERAFNKAKAALKKLREDAMEKQPKELNRPLGEEVHITYPEEAGIVTTLAGMGEQGRKNGPGATATFNRPQGIAITPWTPRTIRYGVCGVVYVADTMNHMIRAIDREGNVTTYAGDGRPGYVDGGCAVARFHEPCGITVNSDGDIFVVDRVNHCVRMIEMKTKKVSTFVGAPVPGYFDGGKIAGRFHCPRGIGVDRYNNLYLADFINNRIRKITPDRRVTTLVGDGTFRHAVGRTGTSKTAGPAYVAVDTWGSIYFTDMSHRVSKIWEEKSMHTLAGSGHPRFGDGFGEYAHFDQPSGVCVDHVGTLFVSDYGNHKIRVVESNGFTRTLAGCGRPGMADGAGEAAAFNHPTGIAVGPGYVLVADQWNHCIRRVTVKHRVPIIVPEAEPDTDVDSVNSLEEWYLVHRADNASLESEDSPGK